jgi:hypothetical protein
MLTRYAARPLLSAQQPGAFASGPYRGRTCDLGIKSPLLYQLS